MALMSGSWGSPSVLITSLVISGSGLLIDSTTRGGPVLSAVEFAGSSAVIEGSAPRSLTSSFFSSSELIGG